MAMQHRDKELSSTLQMKMMLGEERIEPIGAPHLPEFYFFLLQASQHPKQKNSHIAEPHNASWLPIRLF